MPVYECARCNNLTYSASRFAAIDCDRCGGSRHRSLEHAFSFDEAREAPRTLDHGDHCCVAFDTPSDVAPLCAHVLRSGVASGARVISWPQEDLAAAIRDALEPHEVETVEWMSASDVYGDPFDGEAVVERFRDIAESETRPLHAVGGFDVPLQQATTPEGYRAFEQLVTRTAIETGMLVVCLFDRRLHDPSFLHTGEETHPLTSEGGPVKRNERFVFA